MATEQNDLDTAMNLILQYCEINHVRLKSNSSIVSDEKTSESLSGKEKLSMKEKKT